MSTPATFGLTPLQLSPSPVAVQRAVLDTFARGLRVAGPAIVTAVSSSSPPMLDVTLALTDTERIDGNQTEITVKLTQVPICIPQAGGFVITFPVKTGDEVLLLACDQDIDSWLQCGGTNNTPIDGGRRHSFSDCFAILGIRSRPNDIENYSTEALEIRTDGGETKISIDISGNVQINCQQATVNASAVNVTATGQLNLTGSPVNIHSTGNNTIVDGHQFTLHEHSGVQTGGGISGPVV